MNNNEIWKDVIDFEGYYQVSNFGNVKGLNRKIQNGTGGSYTAMSPGTLAATTADALANATSTALVSVNDTSVSGGTITAYKNGTTANITFSYSSSEISGYGTALLSPSGSI